VTVPDRIVQGGRSKAYRPLPRAQRLDAISAGLEAYRRGEFFEAHELLEPAWMGTRDIAERDALQGLIKLAAAYVHAVRGNAIGVEKNLAGAQERLDRAESAQGLRAVVGGLDLRSLTIEIGVRRARLAASSAAALGSLDAQAILALVPPPLLDGTP
jgi:Domain of unknown function (DUF309)